MKPGEGGGDEGRRGGVEEEGEEEGRESVLLPRHSRLPGVQSYQVKSAQTGRSSRSQAKTGSSVRPVIIPRQEVIATATSAIGSVKITFGGRHHDDACDAYSMTQQVSHGCEETNSIISTLLLFVAKVTGQSVMMS
ncbi:hypothetical protein DPEC_G00227190 [Dallia pectoralis]|uniref:Uncharacterized protein n=1 Tax=Dallia pectoralis TaxID=75939 RepID=A0ACC2G124_DALPE|nr:hypothetical protein DPEC_G00227190 [Dallia pectoralis]